MKKNSGYRHENILIQLLDKARIATLYKGEISVLLAKAVSPKRRTWRLCTNSQSCRGQEVLENLKFADYVVKIVLSFGAKVYRRRPWGYVELDCIFALKKANHDWILYLGYR